MTIVYLQFYYLPSLRLKKRSFFRHFLYLCLFILRRRFLSTLLRLVGGAWLRSGGSTSGEGGEGRGETGAGEG